MDSCLDQGPWPCDEDGCPAPQIDCPDLEGYCDTTFDEVWSTPPASVAGEPIAAYCPDTCGRCSVEYDVDSTVTVSIERADRPSHAWNADAVAAYESGDLPTAVERLAVATHQHPYKGELFANMALALTALTHHAASSARLPMVCEAKAAAQLAASLGHRVDGLLENVIGREAQLVASAAAGSAVRSCADTAGGTMQQRIDAALVAPSRARAVERLCTPTNLVLRPSAAERSRELLGAKTLRAAWALMRVCGVLVGSAMLPPHLVATAADAAAAHHAAANVSARLASLRASGADGDDAGVAIRGSPRRVEVKLPMAAPFTDEGLVASPLPLSLLRLWLHGTGGGGGGGGGAGGGGGDDAKFGDAFELDSFSYIRAEPGAPAQQWHRDVAALQPPSPPPSPPPPPVATTEEKPAAVERGAAEPKGGGGAWLRAHQLAPPHAVVQITPLADVDGAEGGGATQFLCGSHAEEHMRATAATDDAVDAAASGSGASIAAGGAQRGVSLPVRRGDVVFFDIRLAHRGTAYDPTTATAATATATAAATATATAATAAAAAAATGTPPAPRTLLYTSYARRWFRGDAVNFASRQSRAWDGLPSLRLQGLLARVDAREYVERLEEAVRALGGDPEELRSQSQRQRSEPR